MRSYYVYIMASIQRTLYIGMTNNLARRVYEHKDGMTPGFTSRYRIVYLVHTEEFADPRSAIGREKQLKGWRRDKKVALNESKNPHWRDLSDGWYEDENVPPPRNSSNELPRRDSSLRSE